LGRVKCFEHLGYRTQRKISVLSRIANPAPTRRHKADGNSSANKRRP